MYTAGYLCFMRSAHDNVAQANWQQKYLDRSSIDYNAMNALVVEDFLLNCQDLEHWTQSVQYILLSILATCYPKSVYWQKICLQDGCQVSKYAKWLVPLSNIQCLMEKTKLLLLPTLLLDEVFISGTIDILKKYLKRLELDKIAVTNKSIICKGDFLMVCNITRAIYQQRNKKRLIYWYQYIEPIAGFFHMQINVLKLFLVSHGVSSRTRYH